MTKNSKQGGGAALNPFWESHPVLEIIFLTLCEATARSTKLRNVPSCKGVFYQKIRSIFANYSLPFSESICLIDHEKQI